MIKNVEVDKENEDDNFHLPSHKHPLNVFQTLRGCTCFITLLSLY